MARKEKGSICAGSLAENGTRMRVGQRCAGQTADRAGLFRGQWNAQKVERKLEEVDFWKTVMSQARCNPGEDHAV